MRLLRLFLSYFLGLVGIALISVIPIAYNKARFETSATDVGFFSAEVYIKGFKSFFDKLFHFDQWTYMYRGAEEPIIQFLWDPYLYSIKLMIGSMIVGVLVGLILAMITLFLPRKAVQPIINGLSLFETIPDLILALFFQIAVVWFYGQTGVQIAEFTTIDGEIYLLPIIVLATLPVFTFYRVILLLMGEENRLDYVEFAKSKGLQHYWIVFRHMLPNIVKSIFYQSKLVLWVMLSSLFIVEYIFAINGITSYMLDSSQSFIIFISLSMLFTPFYLFYEVIEGIINKGNQASSSFFIYKNQIRFSSFLKRKPKHRRTSPKVALKNITESWVRFGKGMIPYFKNVKFLIGFGFLFLFSIVSILYSIIPEDPIEQKRMVYGEDGELVSAPPHSPEHAFLLGSDGFGFSIMDQIIVGAKYTILFALLIALLRIFIGFLFAIPYTFVLGDRSKLWLDKIIGSMHFLPITLLALLLLRPVLYMPPGGWPTTMTERIIYQIVVLTLLVVPITTSLIGNEMRDLLHKEYLLQSSLMGANWLHLLKKHIIPHLSPRLGIVFCQQFIQTLLLFIHLGIFEIFFGGTIVSRGLIADPPRTSSYEWSGMIGNAKDHFLTGKEWMVIPVLIAFMITIFAMQILVQGMKEVQQGQVGIGRRFRRKDQNDETDTEKIPLTKDRFTMYEGSSDYH